MRRGDLTLPRMRPRIPEIFGSQAPIHRGSHMNLETLLRFLRVPLVLFGLIFLVGVYPLMMAWWPAGWRWQPNQPEYEQMILGVYATLGVFLIIASRNPLQHRSLIWFTVCSSLVHGGIMAVQALNMPAEHGRLLGDIPALLLVAVVLAVLMPRGASAEMTKTAAQHATAS
jgi:hypothetical protein